MDEPEKKLDIDLGQIDAINNLDTARMTLRWALERIHGVEKEKNEAAKSLEKAHRDLLELQRSAAMRADDEQQRELYYSKMEELISLHLAGKLNVEALVRQQAETTQLQQFLLEKQTLIDRDFTARKEKLELEYRRLMEDHEQKALAQRQAFENSTKELRLTLERDHASRLVALHEGEIRLKQQERVITERSAQFEIFYKTQRAALETDIARFRADVDDQVRFRAEGIERLLIEKHSVAEGAWAKEKTLILQELAEWRHKAQEQSPLLAGLEKKLNETEHHASELSAALARETDWRKKIEAREQAVETAHQARLVDLESKHRDKEAELIGRIRQLESRREEISRDQQARVLDLEKRLAEAEGKSLKAEQSFAQQAEANANLESSRKALESRLVELEAQRAKRESDILLQQQELDRRRQEIAAEQLPRILELEKLLAGAGQEAQKLSADLAREAEARAKIEAREQAVQARAQASFSELEAKHRDKEAELIDRIRLLETRREEITRDQQARVLDLEKRLAEAEGKSLKAEQSFAQQAEANANLESSRKALETRLVELEAQRAKRESEILVQQQELDRRRQEIAAEQLPRILELEKLLAGAGQEAQRLSADLEGRLRAAAAAQSPRVSELERHLAAAEEEARNAAELLVYETELNKGLEESRRSLEARLLEMEAQRARRESEMVSHRRELDRRREELSGEQLSCVLELERRVAEAEERARKAAEAAVFHEAEGRAKFEAREQGLEAQKLLEELNFWRAKAQDSSERTAMAARYEARILDLEARLRASAADQSPRVSELERHLATSEEKARAADFARAQQEEAAKGLESKLRDMEKRLKDEGRLTEEIEKREAALEARHLARLSELSARAAKVEEREQRAAQSEAALKEQFEAQAQRREAAGQKELEERTRKLESRLRQEIEEREAASEARHLARLSELSSRAATVEEREQRGPQIEAALKKQFEALAQMRVAAGQKELEERTRELEAAAEELSRRAVELEAERNEFSELVREFEERLKKEEGPEPPAPI